MGRGDLGRDFGSGRDLNLGVGDVRMVDFEGDFGSFLRKCFLNFLAFVLQSVSK